MSGKWTPGPWIVGKGVGYFITRPNARMAHAVGLHPYGSLVGAEGGDEEEARANAHVMAQSPEMFSVLEAMVERFGHDIFTMPQADRELLTRAVDVLAKAKGEGA